MMKNLTLKIMGLAALMAVTGCHGVVNTPDETTVVANALASQRWHVVEVQFIGGVVTAQSQSSSSSALTPNDHAAALLCDSTAADGYAFKAVSSDTGKMFVGVACMEQDRSVSIILKSNPS